MSVTARQLLALRSRKGSRHWRAVLARQGFKAATPPHHHLCGTNYGYYIRRDDERGDADLAVLWAGEVQLWEPGTAEGGRPKILCHAVSIRNALEGS